MTKIAIILSMPVFFLLSISVSRIFVRPVSTQASAVQMQQVKTENTVFTVNLIELASQDIQKSVIQTREKVVVFVLDCFKGEDSHGKNVLRIIQKNNFNKCEVKTVDLGYAINKKEYLKALIKILNFVQNNSEVGVVVNLSFGNYSYDPIEEVIIKKLSERGVIIIAAAGNESTSSLCYPAAYDETIAVAAVNSSGRKEKYSNYGSWIDIASKGHLRTEIQSIESKDSGAYREEKITYLIKGGTSFAAPKVTGLTAYILNKRPDLSGREVVQILKTTAKALKDPAFRTQLGIGSLNWYKALWRTDRFMRNIFKAEIIGLFIFAIIWLIECIIGLFRWPRDFITPFMCAVFAGIAIFVGRHVAIAATGLFIGNLIGAGILFLLGLLSIIIPPYLWWSEKREREEGLREVPF